MCLAFPAKIIKLDGANAVVEFHNVKRDVRLDLVGECQLGEHVLVHAGFAINKLDEEAARETIEVWKELIAVMEDENSDTDNDQSLEKA